MRYDNSVMLNNGSMPATGTLVSNGVDLQQIALCSVHCVWTGTPTGNLTVEVSNDNVQPATGGNPSANVKTWTLYTASAQATGGAAGDFLYNLMNAGYRWVRTKYTATSGSGNLTVTFMGKGV